MKEPSALPDVQLALDKRGIELEQAGINEIIVPLLLKRPGAAVPSTARCRISTSLCKELRGTHMSRLVSVLQVLADEGLSGLSLLPLLKKTLGELPARRADASIRFTYSRVKPAPLSEGRAFSSYPCRLSGSLVPGKEQEAESRILALEIPVSNLCPCSKALGAGAAHSQRAYLRTAIILAVGADCSFDWLDCLLDGLESAGSSPVYPLLKREDEKWTVERLYANPKFVEDVARDAVIVLRSFKEIEGFRVEVEALESIHAHNAWASCSENFRQIDPALAVP